MPFTQQDAFKVANGNPDGFTINRLNAVHTARCFQSVAVRSCVGIAQTVSMPFTQQDAFKDKRPILVELHIIDVSMPFTQQDAFKGK